jgi:excinuclease UvrABC helicase subunit UvrB
VYEADYLKIAVEVSEGEEAGKSPAEIERDIASLQTEMQRAAEALRFEEAAALRDRIRYLRKVLVLANA